MPPARVVELLSPSARGVPPRAHPLVLLDDRLRGHGRNEALIDPHDAVAIDGLRAAGLVLHPGTANEPAQVRWRLFGEALVVRVAGARVGVRPVPARTEVPFYLAYTKERGLERQAALIDGQNAADLPWNGDASVTLVGIGRSPFGAPLTAWRGQTITPVSPQHTVTLRAIMQFTDALATLKQAPSAREQVRVGDILVQMITHLALATWDEHATHAARSGSYVTSAALAYIAQYHADVALSPQRVADALGISLRTLQAALAESGTTPASEIAAHRLGHAAHCLCDPAYDEQSVAQIARLSGFATVDTFRRAFVRQFGTSPLAYRRARGRTALSA
ncbi:helix-turn-helix transcriptional regulator [Microbacterium sp. No. 7]|uniref:helix-turn-helix transcriptional regulator n=1 Tax=Microbacterium sp. No. 7 TaxID=1714373 RepID=UPI0006CF8B7A|nr:helix-turn-helix transcriptional regulator [Microbacterium sp. No. 7]